MSVSKNHNFFYFSEEKVDSDTVPDKRGETSDTGSSFYQSLALHAPRSRHLDSEPDGIF